MKLKKYGWSNRLLVMYKFLHKINITHVIHLVTCYISMWHIPVCFVGPWFMTLSEWGSPESDFICGHGEDLYGGQTGVYILYIHRFGWQAWWMGRPVEYVVNFVNEYTYRWNRTKKRFSAHAWQSTPKNFIVCPNTISR